METRKTSYYDNRFNQSLVHDLRELEEFKAKKLDEHFKDRDLRGSHTLALKHSKFPRRITTDTLKNILLNNSVNSYYKSDLFKESESEFDNETLIR